MILETDRLYLREMNQSDYDALCKILQDEETMYAYEGAFSDEEAQYWHQGYATEAARACKYYAFEKLHKDEVCSIIRDTNTASQNVALRNGMSVADHWIKHYRGVDMPHNLYVVKNG